MVNIESFPDIPAVDLTATDYIYFRSTAATVGARDKRFSFSAIMRALLAASDKPAARVAIGIITNTANLDFPSIAANAKADLTIGAIGAAPGDAVFLGLPATPAAGLVFNAYVSAADVVTVRASNTSSGAVDETSMAFRVVVFKST